MTTSYFFHEPGSVPGIPGLFAGVRVDVYDDGTHAVLPLGYHPHVELAPVEETQAAEETPVKGKKPAKATILEGE